MAKKNNDIAISVKNVTKEFTVYEDKSYFLKEKIGHLGRNKKRKHVVLKDISVDILSALRAGNVDYAKGKQGELTVCYEKVIKILIFI